LLEILLMLAAFFYVRSRITAPIINLTEFTRRFAAGEHGVRMDFHSGDEIGELVLTFNATAKQTNKLIDELDRRARENAAMAAILGATTDFVSSASPEGRILYLNRAGYRMLGLAGDEDLSRYVIPDFHPPEVAEHIFNTALPAAAREGVWAGEGMLRSFAGVDIPVSQVIIAHRDENGAVDYYSTIMRDMTPFKALERRLQSSLDFHLKLMQEFPNPIWRVDRIGKCDYVNRAWLEFTGRALEQELGDGWMEGIHPDDRRRCTDAFLAAVARREPFAMEYRMRHRDGGHRWILDHGSPYHDLDGGYAGYLGACYDIDERKQAELQLREQELQYRTLADSGQALIWTSGTDRLCNYFNKVWLEFTGRGMEQELGNGWAEGVHPDDVRRCLEVYTSAFDRRESFSMDYRLRRHDGEYRWIQDDGCPRYDSKGEFIGYIGYCLDITPRKNAEAALLKFTNKLEEKVEERTRDLEHARIEAEHANRAKSDFLAAMSHEIRTPMNGVIGMVDVLRQSSLKGSQIEMVDLIRESALSLLTIIDDILDFSKIEAGRLEVERAPLPLADTVETTCAMLDRLASRKKVEFTLFIDPAVPEKVLGDAVRLRQVLVNLLGNAIKFSAGLQRPGRVSLQVAPVRERPGEVTVEFNVADNGVGMDEKTLARLFTPFTQADVSTTRRFGGTGLGLAISRRLVNMMGGDISVRSKPGEGATFVARIPFTVLPEDAMAGEAPSGIEGLFCLVVGGQEYLAGEIAAYLAGGGAIVERAVDLAATDAAVLPPGLGVWVIATGENPPPESLRAAAHAQPQQDVRFVVVGRGQRRKPRVVAQDLVALDGGVLKRRALFKAAAIAAGRAQEEVETPLPGEGGMAAPLPTREEARRQGQLILVAEDNDINQRVIMRQLASLGFAADVADDGRKALGRWQSGDYALLLTDLHMPEMDGYELAAAIREIERDDRRLPIIALTANALYGEAERCLAAGMDDYLSKPARLEELRAMLEKWLPQAGYAAPKSRSPHDNAGNAPGFHPGYMAREEKNHRTQGVPLQQSALPVDVNVLKALVGDDPAVIREFLGDFRTSAAKIAAELQAACDEGRAKQVVALAHKLKSSARSVGALALGELCAKMEHAGKAEDTSALAALLPEFEAAAAAVDGYLASFLG
jgi:PAS domain S-box-containing protein